MIVLESAVSPATDGVSEAIMGMVLLASASGDSYTLEALREEVEMSARLLSELGIGEGHLSDTFIKNAEDEVAAVRTESAKQRVLKAIDKLIMAAEWSEKNWNLKGDLKQGAVAAGVGAGLGGAYGAALGSGAGAPGVAAGAAVGFGLGGAALGAMGALAHAIMRKSRSKQDITDLISHLRRLRSELEAKHFD